MTLVRDIDLQVALIEYPDMKRYLRTFQVPIDPAYKTSFKLRERSHRCLQEEETTLLAALANEEEYLSR